MSRFAAVGITSCGVTGTALVFPNSYASNPVLSDGRTSLLDATDSGEVGNQQVTLDDTKNSAIGNVAPGNTVAPLQAAPDGFLLRGSCPGANCQLIVFMGGAGGAHTFGIGVAGFVANGSGLHANTDGFASNREFRAVIGPVPVPALPPQGLLAAALLLTAVAAVRLRRAADRG